MRQLNFFIAAMRGSWRKRLLAGLGVLLAFAVLQFGAARLTQAQQGGSDFDHASTGYVLNAQHQNVRCETCHTNGTFKGTPKDCVSCHGWNNPRAKSSVMPTTHIPTGNASCESCHAAAQAQFSDASRTFNHATVVTLTCVNCHSSRNPHPGVVTNPNDATHVAAFALNQGCDKCHTTAQFSGTKVPANHIPTAAVACSSCHIGGDYKQKPTVSNIHAFAPSTSSNCVQCHSAASAAFYRTADMVIPSPATVGNHIPMGSRSCESCHVGAGSSITNTPVTEGSAFGGSLFNHAGATASCATCHGASVTPTTFYGVSPRAISDLQPAHVPTSAACETCHLSGAPAGLVPAAGMTTFANAQFSHTGISSGCATCHGPTLGNSSFYGVTNLIVMPATSPAGNLSHMPTSTTCESCHAASTPSSPVPAVSPRALGSSLFRNGPPTSGMIHSGVSAGCGACHGGTSTWVGVDLPIYTRNFNTVQAGSGVLYTGFQTLPGSGGTYSIPDSGHPNNDTCEQCHTSTTAFGGISLPSGHIPYVAGVGCGVCHDSSFSTSPSIAAIHSNIQSRASNCEQCHSTDNAALYASTTKRRAIKTPTPNHVPMGSLGCASCHVGANTGIPITPVTASSFAGAGFLHTGISSGCVNCHGANVAAGTFDGVTPTSVSGQTPVHIPVSSNIGCETCHANSIPPGLVTTSGYTGPTFAGGKYIHTGVTTGCATCHGAGVGPFKGVSNLVLMPSTAAPNGHIPSSSACESCHLASVPTGLLAVSGSPTSPPGTGFANAPPNGSLIHADVSGGCNSCHEAGNSWLGMSAYRPTPSAKNTTNPAQLYTGFHTRPGTAGGYSMADSSHPAGTGECSVCHGNTVAFGLPSLPTKHIPFASTASCAACHVSWGTSPTIADIHNNLQSASTNCAQCHSDANATAYSTANRAIMRPASNHVPMRTLGCESCHVGAGTGIVNTPVTATSFAGGLFSHSGMGTNCAECHGPAVTGFQGITRIAKMPPTTPAGSIASHIPSSTTCENCHLGSMPSSRIAANAAVLPPGSGFLQSPPVSALIHTGVSGGCSNCHDTNMEWMGVGAYPKQVSPRFTGFHSRPQGGVGTYWVTDAVHPAGGDCSSCHTGFTEWSTNVKPANHIPTANVACANCHTSANYSDMPLRDAIHANAQSTTANCAQCHSAANALLYNTTAMTIKAPASNHIPMGNLGCESCHVGSNSSLMTPVGRTAVFSNSAFSHTGVTSGCATCHGNIDGSTFQGGQIPVTMTTPALTPVHVPNPANLDCGSCHLAIPTGLSRIGSTSTTFAGGKYSHSGISNGCDACHGSGISGSSFKGITAIVVLPPTTSGASNHIPSPINAKCETCHMGSMPTTLVNASATVTTPGSTKFKTPIPTGAMIHTGISGSCNSCHEAGMTWVDVSLYPRTPSVKTANASYTGFHTRPNSPASINSVLDANHPGGTTDCSACHGSTVNFSSVAKPSNHIPTSTTAQCQNCHTNLVGADGVYVSSSVNFVQTMSLTNIHAYAPSTTSNCAQCHSAANAAIYAIPSIGFSIKSPASVANHIPYGATACEACHVYTGGPLSTPVRDGSTFGGGMFSHAGFSTGCATCHGANVGNTTFTGVTAIVAIPASTTTNGNLTHIPYTAGCETCHAASVPSGLVSVTTAVSNTANKFATPLATGSAIHSNSSGFTCKTCHERAYQWLGMAKYPHNPLTLNLAAPTTAYMGFHTRPGSGATTYGFTDAGHTGGDLDTADCSNCHAGTSAFTGEGKPSGHMPFSTAGCTTCHTPGNYTATGLIAGNLHSGVTVPTALVTYTAATLAANASCKTCHTVGTGGTSGTAPFAGCDSPANCASPPPITYQPKTVTGIASHIPIKNLSCDACHVGTSTFRNVSMAVKPGGTTMHNNVKLAGIKCLNCHELGMEKMWTGLTLQVRTSKTHTTTAMMAPNDCSNCHSFNGGFKSGKVRPVMRSAQVDPEGGRMRPTMQPGKISRGSLGNSFDHTGVEVGKCKTCHDGKAASGMPARHLMVSTSCDTCHRTSTWLPAQFNHNGVSPNTCQACHNGMSASGRPAGHFNTTRSCDVCHKNMSWTPVNYQHLSPLYVPSPDKLTCVSCHTSNGELMRRQLRGLTRTKPIPVGP